MIVIYITFVSHQLLHLSSAQGKHECILKNPIAGCISSLYWYALLNKNSSPGYLISFVYIPAVQAPEDFPLTELKHFQSCVCACVFQWMCIWIKTIQSIHLDTTVLPTLKSHECTSARVCVCLHTYINFLPSVHFPLCVVQKTINLRGHHKSLCDNILSNLPHWSISSHICNLTLFVWRDACGVNLKTGRCWAGAWKHGTLLR